MTTDGGGFMLIGRKNNPITWTVPSNSETVEPYGEPHWSSSLGDALILDFRVQMATKEDFKTTKAHWSVSSGSYDIVDVVVTCQFDLILKPGFHMPPTSATTIVGDCSFSP